MWTWSELDEAQMERLTALEAELGGGYILAYRAADPERDRPVSLRMTPAELDERQLSLLHELERETGCVAVAYADD